MAVNRYVKSAIYLGSFTGLGYFLMVATEPDPEVLKEKFPERQVRAEDLKADSDKRNQGLMNILKATSQGTDVTKAVEIEKAKLRIEYEKQKLIDAHKTMLESRASVKEE